MMKNNNIEGLFFTVYLRYIRQNLFYFDLCQSLTGQNDE